MNSLSLYNIPNKFAELMDKVQNGEITEEEYNELGEELALELQNKSANIIGYTQNKEYGIRSSILKVFIAHFTKYTILSPTNQ